MLNYKLSSSVFCHIKHCIVTLCMAVALISIPAKAHGQASVATASRKADLQVGGEFVLVPVPDYTQTTFYGGGGYATLDLKYHLGIEANFRLAEIPNDYNLYEKTYEIGGRYVRHYGRWNPYVRVSYGRGVFNFIYNQANLAYNMVAAGGGVDYSVAKHVNARLDYDFQHWMSFPPNGLQPQVISVGAAYHF